MNYSEYSDEELYSLICEDSSEAKDIFYAKYKYLIDILMHKYAYAALRLGVEYSDLYQEALLAFSDALVSYRDDQNASLPTFISLCVNRRLQKVIVKAGRPKNKILVDSLSLDQTYDGFDDPLKEMISDGRKNDPLQTIAIHEENDELSSKIKEILSKNELEVYTLMIHGLKYNEIADVLGKSPKQIDNTMQRIRNKVRELLKERK